MCLYTYGVILWYIYTTHNNQVRVTNIFIFSYSYHFCVLGGFRLFLVIFCRNNKTLDCNKHFGFVCLVWFLYFVFGDKVSLYSSGWPETLYVDQVDLKLTEIDLRASASRVMGLTVSTTTPS